MLLAPGDVTARTAALIRAFLSGRNERTLRAYRQDLEDFRLFTGAATSADAVHLLLDRGLGGANALALGYKNSLIERGLQAATINRRLAALRSLVKLARTLGIVSWPLEVSNVRAQAYRDTRGPDRDGVRLLLDAAETARAPRGLRDRAALRLLYDLGLRRGEVVALNVDDVDLTRGTVAVTSKGSTQKILLTLPAPTQAALAEWLAARAPGGGDGPLFTNFDPLQKGEGRLTGHSLYRIVREMGEKVGVRVRPHGLRHAAITQACIVAQAEGIALEEILDFSRHKDVKTLMIYRDRERNVQGRLSSLIADL